MDWWGEVWRFGRLVLWAAVGLLLCYLVLTVGSGR